MYKFVDREPIEPAPEFEIQPEPDSESEVIYLFRGVSKKHHEGRIGQWWSSTLGMAEGRGDLYVAAVRKADLPELSSLQARARRTNAPESAYAPADFISTYILDKADPANARKVTRKERKALSRFKQHLRDAGVVGEEGLISEHQKAAELVFEHTFDMPESPVNREQESPTKARWFFRANEGPWSDDLNAVLDAAGESDHVSAALISEQVLSETPHEEEVSLTGPVGQEVNFQTPPEDTTEVRPDVLNLWRRNRPNLSNPDSQYKLTVDITPV